MAGADSSNWWRKAADTSTAAVTRTGAGNCNLQTGVSARRDDSSGWRGSASSNRQQHCTKLSRAAAGALTHQLRTASTPESLQELLVCNQSCLAAPHVSAAFNALANMTQAHPRVVEPLLRQHLLPALDTLLEEAEAAADPTEAATEGATTGSSGSSSGSTRLRHQQLDSQCCAVILQSLSRLQDRSGLAVPSSVAQCLLLLFLKPPLLQQAIPQGITMVATAAAKLQVRAGNMQLEQLMSVLLDLVASAAVPGSSKKWQLNPMHVSQTLWGVATMLAAQRLSPPTGQLLQLFTEVAALLTAPQLGLLQEAKPVEVCNTLSAFVIAELPASSLPNPGFAAELLRHLAALQNLRNASARDISRTLWAAAKLGAQVETADCKALVAKFCSSEMSRSTTAQDIANLLWALGILQQHDAVTSHELCILAATLLDHAQRKRAAPQEISTTLWGLATLQAQLPRQLLVQIQEQFRQPHILQEIAKDETESLGLINTLWAAAALHKAGLAGASKNWRALQQQQDRQQQANGATGPPLHEPVLSPAAVQQLTDMLTAPGRVSHLTPCAVGLCLWSTAVLGGSLSFDQVRALIRRFLQPSCQALALPLNFTNTVWGCVRLGRVDALQEPGVLQQLVAAYFKAGAPGGAWSGSSDPMAASMLLWAIAKASKDSTQHCARPSHSRRLGRLAKQLPCGEQDMQQQDSAEQQQQQQQQQQEQSWQEQHEGSSCHADVLVPKKQVQQLFSIYLQRSSIKQADCITMSTALYAAAALALPVGLDDLNWVIRAYMAKVEEAGATSAALMLEAITKLQRAALSQSSSSSSRPAGVTGGSWGADRLDAAHADSLVPVLAQLTQEIGWRMQFDVESDDISMCVLGLSRAFLSGDELPASCGWTNRHRQQLQQALLGLLKQLLQPGVLRKLNAAALLDVVWSCGEMGVSEPQLLDAVCQELRLLGPQREQQQHQLLQQQEGRVLAAAEAEVSLRPAAPYRPRHMLQQQQQQQRHTAAEVRPVQRDREWLADAAKCSQLLAALASLNHLKEGVWLAAVQPHLPAAASRNASNGVAAAVEAILPWLTATLEWVPLMCWAAAVGDLRSCSSTVLQLVKGLAAGSAGTWAKVALEMRCQLYQVHLWLEAAAAAATTQDSTDAPAQEVLIEAAAAPAAPGAVDSRSSSSGGLAAVLSAEQLEQCRQDWCAQAAVVSPSALQARVATVLQLLPGVAHVQLEALTEDRCFSMDIAAVVGDKQQLVADAQQLLVDASAGSSTAAVAPTDHGGSMGSSDSPTRLQQQQQLLLAVEVDGPQHFVYPEQQLNGESRLRTRLLQARGYAVARVSWYEWQQLGSGSTALQQQQQQQVEEDEDGCQLASSAAEACSLKQKQLQYLAAKVAAAL